MSDEQVDSKDAIFADAGEPETEPTAEPESEEQPEVSEEVAEEPEAPKLDFGGLPFKDIKSFVKAHKELQREFTTRNNSFKELEKMVKDLVASKETGTPQGQVREQADPQAFVDEFVQNPQAVLNRLVQQAVRQSVEPLQKGLGSVAAQSEMDKFLSAHPEMDEEAIGWLNDVIDEYPELLGTKNRLDKY